jgi:hypothetical protein
MRIAAIYFPTSSVGGINTILVELRKEAEAQGDTFEVLRCGNLATIKPERFEPKLIRGGDTFITIHGDCSHHPNQIEGTLKFLEENYDAVYFSSLCPHPNKAYGDEPVFLPLYEKLNLPKVALIPDAYFSTYADWGVAALRGVKKAFTTQPAFAEPMIKAGLPVKGLYAPITEVDVSEFWKSQNPSAVWTSQWKAIKGIDKLLPHIPEITKHCELDMYSNGILYYQMRETPEWKAAIAKDHFKGFDGEGKAHFYGYIDLDKIPGILAKSWFMIDLQGIGKPKHKAYQQGAYNYSTIEALLYGSCPILSEQTKKSIVPQEFYLTVDNADQVAELIRTKQDFALDQDRIKAAREWVLKQHSSFGMYNELKSALLGSDAEPFVYNPVSEEQLKKEDKSAVDMFAMWS